MSEKESNDSENANVSDTEDEITKSEERPEGDSEPLQGAIEKLSEHKPEVASEFMAMMGAGPMTNPLHRKMEGSHITQLLELAADHDEREFELQKQAQENASSDRSADRRYYFGAFVVVAILFVILLFLFRDKPNVLIPALTGLGGLVSGFLGGWGVGRYNSRE
jgi:hypothetical protein